MITKSRILFRLVKLSFRKINILKKLPSLLGGSCCLGCSYAEGLVYAHFGQGFLELDCVLEENSGNSGFGCPCDIYMIIINKDCLAGFDIFIFHDEFEVARVAFDFAIVAGEVFLLV